MNHFSLKFYPPVLDVIDRNTSMHDFIYYHIYKTMGIFVVPSHYITRYTFLHNAINKFYSSIVTFDRYQDVLYKPIQTDGYFVALLLQWNKKIPDKQMSISSILQFLNENTSCIISCCCLTPNGDTMRILPPILATPTKSILPLVNEIHGKHISDVRILILLFVCSILAERRIYSFDYISCALVWNHPELDFFSTVFATMDFRDISVQKYDTIFTEVFEFSRMNSFTCDLASIPQINENLEYTALVRSQYMDLRKKCVLECRFKPHLLSSTYPVTRLFLNTTSHTLFSFTHYSFPYDIFIDGILLLHTTRVRQYLIECLFHTSHKRAMCLLFSTSSLLTIVQPTVNTQTLLHQPDLVIDFEQLLPHDIQLDMLSSIKPFSNNPLFHISHYPIPSTSDIVFDIYYAPDTSITRLVMDLNNLQDNIK
jgi:hypothetical protein